MTKHFGTLPGSTFWYRLIPNEGPDAYETARCDPGTKPKGRGWKQGQRPRTEEEKEHLSQVMTGREMSEDWRAKMSAASKGKPKSEAHKKAMSLALIERHRKRKAGEI